MQIFRREPQMPLEAELFITGERNRAACELNRLATTTDREFADGAIQSALETAERVVADPSEKNIEQALRLSTTLPASFVLNAIKEATFELVDFLDLPLAERAQNTIFIEKSRGIGQFLLHGARVARWTARHPREELTSDNVVAAAMAGALIQEMGKRNFKRYARTFLYAH